jgi:hypothetical protein
VETSVLVRAVQVQTELASRAGLLIPHRSFLTTLSYVQFQSITSRGKSSAKLLLKAMPRCCNRCFTKQLVNQNSRSTDTLPTFTKLQRSLCRNSDSTECYSSVSATRFLLRRHNRPPRSPDLPTKDLFPLELPEGQSVWNTSYQHY